MKDLYTLLALFNNKVDQDENEKQPWDFFL